MNKLTPGQRKLFLVIAVIEAVIALALLFLTLTGRSKLSIFIPLMLLVGAIGIAVVAMTGKNKT